MHNGAAFSNSEHSDLIFLLKKITKKLNSQFPQTLLELAEIDIRMHETSVKVHVGAREPSEVETTEIPRIQK